ncbi:MAG: Zn-dependent hydrolase [Proteobacteria bacterium]|nr:Zn-dependent hydrolase [Pseudomonadota bacterium]
MTAPLVDGRRLWASLMEMAEIGAAGEGGVCRPALSDDDRRARERLIAWCRDIGLEVTLDRIGNLFAWRKGRDPARAPVLLGSHLDSQPTGGRFDGALGVLAGLEVLRALAAAGIETAAPLVLANWTNEEGWRFQPAMLGAAVFAGLVPLDSALAAADAEGRTVGSELARIGQAGPDPVGGRAIDSYFELHIEQGPVLEEEGAVVGVVSGALGRRRIEVGVAGEATHAATFPMPRRRDALVGAARMVEAVWREGTALHPAGRATVGLFEVAPSSRNVVPGRVRFVVDIRHPDEAALARAEAELGREFREIAEGLGLGLDIAPGNGYPPVPFDPACVALVREAARALGLPARELPSGAGHDAVQIARVAPAAMIFVPCRRGVSHSPEEAITPDWAEAGANVLLRAVLARAG